MTQYILGISALYHDSAAALLADGSIVAAAQQERFSRKKHDASLPQDAVAYCLEQAGIKLSDVTNVVFYDKPFLKFERLLETYLSFAPRGFSSFRRAMPLWLKEKLFQRQLISDAFKALDPAFDWNERLLFSEHHLSHAASAFYPSPYDEAIVLTMDGVGEWATTSVAIGRGNQLTVQKEIHFPHSLGLLYSAATYYAGFKVNSGEYKLMGLAPYGTPRFKELLMNEVIDIKADGSFRLDQRFFDYCTGLRMTNERWNKLFGRSPRQSGQALTQLDMDVAASVQAVIEEVVLRLTRALRDEYKISNLCLAGGVALNCVANGRILRDDAFANLWIQPAAGDAGGALGAALYCHYAFYGHSRDIEQPDAMQGAYLGPQYSQGEIESELKAAGAVFTRVTDDELYSKTAQAIADGKAVGWYQGRMEYGPRALGNRSILADPRSADMQKRLNLKIKYRESFRPFAPSVLTEDAEQWFELGTESPYMLLVANVAQEKQIDTQQTNDTPIEGLDRLNLLRSEIPAVTHVDYSARIQTVNKETNPRYYELISHFKKLTGCPVIVNTSFNVRGEPIVCTPKEAFACFMGTELDLLSIGNCMLQKQEQDPSLATDHKAEFELD